MKISIMGVSFTYDGVEALSGVSLEVGGGEVLSLVGPNGSGKSTLLKCMCSVLKPKLGAVLVDGAPLSAMSRREVAKRFSYMPQHVEGGLSFTVFEAVLAGRTPHLSWEPSDEDYEAAWAALKSLSLEGLASRRLEELSGGERQLVLIAQAMAQGAKALLLDEPTAHLDLKNQLEVLSVIKKAALDRGVAVVMAMHDLNLAARFSDKMALMKRGRIVALGRVREVLRPELLEDVYRVKMSLREVEGLEAPLIVPLWPS